MMNSVVFNKMYRETCSAWWAVWKTAANIEDVNRRNDYLDKMCAKYANEVKYSHEAMLMQKLTQVAKDTLEEYQFPIFGKDEYENVS